MRPSARVVIGSPRRRRRTLQRNRHQARTPRDGQSELPARASHIGKIGICDDILLKPGRLEDSEWEQIRRHPVIGAEICKPLRSVQGQLPTIRHHHERWDGDGYPDGLRRDEIPLSARITAVCDAWDAITSDRVYRPGLAPERAIEILVSGKGGQWDRDLIELFVAHQPDITSLAGLEASFDSGQLAHLGEPVS